MSKFNEKKKGKVKRSFARIVRGGKWHVVVDEGDVIFFPCQHYGWSRDNRVATKRVFGIFRGPFNGYIFTSPRKICGTCMKMERNRKTLKEAGFVTLKEAGFVT